MEPITIGIVTAALIQKVLDRTEDRAIGAGMTAIEKLRQWLRTHMNPAGQHALTELEAAPDSPSRAKALAAAIDIEERQAGTGSGFATELRAIIDEVRAAGVDVTGVANQTAWGSQNAQVANNAGEVTININSPDPTR